MRWIFLAAITLMSFILTSCKTGMTVEGEPCYALSEEEVAELVQIARYSLRKPSRQLSAADVKVISTTAPEVLINYSGDCSGEVKIRWTLPDKRAGVRFAGLLNDPRRRASVFEIIPNNDRVVYKGVPGKRDTAK